MGVGLGKNSPVKLTLGRENYEALLERHGQWIRWRTANKCPCINEHTQQPDIRCKQCHGRGVVYSYQPNQTVQTVILSKDDTEIISLEEEYKDDSLVRIYDRNGKDYSAEKNGTFVVFDTPVQKGTYYNLLLNRKNVLVLKEVELSCDNEYFCIPDLEVNKATVDGVYYTAPGDILGIESIVDFVGEEFEVEEFRLNKILLKKKIVTKDGETEIIEPILPLKAKNISYIKPFTFALINQNLSKGDFNAMVDAQGDAVLLTPYSYDVSEGDVLTVLAGTITQKDVIARTGDTKDVLSAFFVAEIIKIIDKDGKEYINGVDYVLSGTNHVKWINDTIEVGDGYSVTYKVYPTYTVVKNIPQLRSSENQRFPKKAIVKFMSSYSEKRNINRQ